VQNIRKENMRINGGTDCGKREGGTQREGGITGRIYSREMQSSTKQTTSQFYT